MRGSRKRPSPTRQYAQKGGKSLPKALIIMFPCLVLLLSLVGSADGLRIPLNVIGRRVGAAISRDFFPPSPFALSSSFEPSVFSPADCRESCVALSWDSEVALDRVEALISVALSKTPDVVVAEIGRASDGVRIVVRGARRSCLALIQLAAMSNLAVQTATWS